MQAKRRIHRDIEEIPEDHTISFWAWWNKWGLWTLTSVALALAIVAVYRWVSASRTAAHERAWGELAGATSPESLRQVALENSNDPAVGALAQLRAGDLLLGRVVDPESATRNATTKPASGLGSSNRSPEEERSFNLKAAEDAYKAVLSGKDVSVVIQLNARLGLAAVAESREDWGKARESYEAAIKQAGDEFPLIKSQAVARKALLDRLPSSLAFSPEKPPAPPVDEKQALDAFPAPHMSVGASTKPAK
jgi:hypothetical protein